MKKYIKIICFVWIIALLLELTAFNFRFYESLFFKEQKVKHTYNAKDKCLSVSDIDFELNNIYLDLKATDKYGQPVCDFEIEVYVKDEGHSNHYKLPIRVIADNVEKSKYINFNLSGNCREILIYIENDEDVKIEGFGINKTRCFDFNILRLFLCFAILMCLWGIKNIKELNKYKFFENAYTGTLCIIVFGFINAMIAILITTANGAFDNVKYEHHYQYQELCEAFEAGSLSLLEEPPSYLSTMKNPYDCTERDKLEAKTKEYYRWDTAYYEGKYYVYFGVVPALIMYLPVYLITGSHLANNVCVGILLVLLIYGILWFVHSVTKRYFKSISLIGYLGVSQAMIWGCHTWYIAKRPDFYVVPITMGIVLSIYGITLWINSVKEDGRINVLTMMAGSLCMALVAGCRPQLVIMSVIGLVIYVGNWKNFRQIFAFFAPYIVVAVGIMWYNYMRFGSVFDFGAAYNLTVDDMTHRGMNWNRVALGAYAYLIQPFTIDVRFPYVKHAKLNTSYMGYTSSENPMAGVFLINSFCVFGMALLRVRAFVQEKRIYAIGLATFLTGMVLMLLDTQMGGIYMRYMTDFAWCFAIAGIVGVLLLLKRFKENAQLHELIVKCAGYMTFVTGLIHGLTIFTDVGLGMVRGNTELFYYMMHTIEFWL